MPTLPELQADFARAVLRRGRARGREPDRGRRPHPGRAGPGLLEPRLLEPDGRARGDVSPWSAGSSIGASSASRRTATSGRIRRPARASSSTGRPSRDFLATFPPCAGHPYLADVARLEWAMNAALHAEDAAPMAPDGARGGAGRRRGTPRLPARPRPRSWLRSPWPVDRIWRRQPARGRPRRLGGPRRRRRARWRSAAEDDVVTLRRLDAAEFAFRARARPWARRSRWPPTRPWPKTRRSTSRRPSGPCSTRGSLTGFTLAPDAPREGEARIMTTADAARDTAAHPARRRGRLARPAGARAAVAPPAPVPPGRGQRVPAGRDDQGVELGVHGRPVPGRVPGAGPPARARRRARDHLRARLLHAPHPRARRPAWRRSRSSG